MTISKVRGVMMGVTKTANGKWRARYTANGVRHNVGRFPTKKQAEEALVAHKWDNGGYLEYEQTERSAPLSQRDSLIERFRKWLVRVIKA